MENDFGGDLRAALHGLVRKARGSSRVFTGLRAVELLQAIQDFAEPES